MGLEFSLHIFETSSNIRFPTNPFIGGRLVQCGKKEKPDEAQSRFSRFCELA
jgi:hypothetical protein